MDDLKQIKAHYGEKMMHYCRDIFPTLLETPGLLYTTLSNTFNPSRFLCEDIMENDLEDQFKSIIFHKIKKDKTKIKTSNKTPQELLREAGYTLYECNSEEDIQSFRKYYAPDEELCTFKGGRLNRCYVFFAVKDNAEKLNRKDFDGEEERQDEYGTSVISIQFTRGITNTLSIKNRYNHTVRNPDATFSNNLDNIIAGLTNVFEETYNLKINSTEVKEDMPGYVLANDGKYYKYTIEENNICYCPDNIIIDNGEVKHFDKSRYIVFEDAILDMQEKKFVEYDSDTYNSIPKSVPPQIDSIKVENIEDNCKRITINNSIEIVLTKTNQIKSYSNPQITRIGNYFLDKCKLIESINLPKVEYIGMSFLAHNEALKSIDLPNIKEIGSNFLLYNQELESINIENCCKIGESFLFGNEMLEEINLPNLENIEKNFLYCNENIKKLSLPKCKKIDTSFLYKNKDLEELDLPEAEEISTTFLYLNKHLRRIYAPKVKIIDYSFLRHNQDLEELDLPSLEKLGGNALQINKKLFYVNVPKLLKLPKENWYTDISNNDVIIKAVENNKQHKTR